VEFEIEADYGSHELRARAYDGGGNWGEAEKDFQRIKIRILPTIPKDGTTVIATPTLDLDWEDVSGATMYQVQVDDDRSFSSPLVDAKVRTSSYALGIQLADGTYYWRVRAQDQTGGWGDWSEIWSFRYYLTLPPPIEIENVELIFIPGGEFQMGDLWGDGDYDERPVHTVRVDDFYMSKYEITVGQFKRFCEATGRSMPSQPSWNRGDDYPVVNVSWYNAVRFCNWLSRQAGLEEVYDESTWEADFSKVGYRLPTEAEWEYAARAGGKEIKYPNGNTLTHDDANYWGTGGRDVWDRTSPVGSFPPNELGLYDMAGNVWEWCNDWYDEDYYSRSPVDNSTGPSSGRYKVLRGGSWDFGPGSCRTANRIRVVPDDTWGNLGFRVVLPVR